MLPRRNGRTISDQARRTGVRERPPCMKCGKSHGTRQQMPNARLLAKRSALSVEEAHARHELATIQDARGLRLRRPSSHVEEVFMQPPLGLTANPQASSM